ncbi:MAG TPA: hypothetical protein VKB14_10315 [Actinomycetales bacterium]|nr:hypothetical protein [Actinomycetales bacterium]
MNVRWDAAVGRARSWRVLGLAALVVSVPAVVVAAPSSGARPGAAEPAMAHGAHSFPDLAAASRPGAVQPAAVTSATDLALELQKLLGQHAVLAAELMRSRMRDDPDLAQAANAAVGKNTRDMAAVVAGLGGPQAAQGFSTQWSTHVAALFNYARGLATDDRQARDQAKSTLLTYEGRVGRDMEASTGGALSADEVTKALTMHVNELIEEADAFKAGDYTRVYTVQRHAHDHMFELGATMAAGFSKAAGRPTSGLDGARWRLRSSLAKALSEHAVLTVQAMRARVRNAPEFAAVAAALDANTGDLAGTIGAVYGDQAGERFQSLWADHLDAFMAYADAARGNDAAAREKAKSTLSGFQGDFAKFLDQASDGKLPASSLAAAFAEHDDMLLEQVDAYAAKSYPQAHDLAYDAYQDVFGMSTSFAGAIADVAGSRLPLGGAQTGGGGTAMEGHPHGG